MTIIDEVLALDLLTLRAHTERAGDAIDADLHSVRVRTMLENASVCSVRKADELAAYAALAPESDTCWFVQAFNTHPLHRTPAVMSELVSKLSELACERGIVALRSHVYKTNHLSIAFHRKLGFRVTRENEKALELFAAVATISQRRAVQRAVRWRAVSPTLSDEK
ncbi:MAG: GNAT family N-acetyltransferase [Janthinobacterium lividum]